MQNDRFNLSTPFILTDTVLLGFEERLFNQAADPGYRKRAMTCFNRSRDNYDNSNFPVACVTRTSPGTWDTCDFWLCSISYQMILHKEIQSIKRSRKSESSEQQRRKLSIVTVGLL